MLCKLRLEHKKKNREIGAASERVEHINLHLITKPKRKAKFSSVNILIMFVPLTLAREDEGAEDNFIR